MQKRYHIYKFTIIIFFSFHFTSEVNFIYVKPTITNRILAGRGFYSLYTMWYPVALDPNLLWFILRLDVFNLVHIYNIIQNYRRY